MLRGTEAGLDRAIAKPVVRAGLSHQQRHLPHTEEGRAVLVTRVGLRIASSIAYELWADAGLEIARAHNSSAWCLGDWIVYGKNRYENRYRDAVEAAGLDYQTVRNYAWVARHVVLARRRENLSFQHHAEVAALTPDEQDHWLDLAVREKLSRNELRRRIRGNRRHEPTLTSAQPLKQIQATSEQVERWRQAADQSRRSLPEWIRSQLDEAAARVLND
jgi:hypothetical protein